MLRSPVLVIATALTLVAGCASAEGTAEPANGSDAPAGQPAAAADALPDAVLPVVGGGELDLTSLEGTALALWFWAPT